MRMSKALMMVMLLTLLVSVLTVVVMGDVTYIERGSLNAITTQSPVKWQSFTGPCGLGLLSVTNTGFVRVKYAVPLLTTSGNYLVRVFLGNATLSTTGTLRLTYSTNPYVSSAYLSLLAYNPSNGMAGEGAGPVRVYPGVGTLSITWPGTYGFNESLYLTGTAMSVLNGGSSITLTGYYNYSPVNGVTYLYSFTQTIQPLPKPTIMNLLAGQSTWYVQHVYQGGNNTGSTNSWPVYYGTATSNANYWAYASTTSNVDNPVLELVPYGAVNSGGAMFWNSSYTAGQSVTITLIGTYTKGTNPPADGFVIYLFITPSRGAPGRWSVSGGDNYSIPFNYAYQLAGGIGGAVILPYGDNYLVVQWDPWYLTTSPPSPEYNIFVIYRSWKNGVSGNKTSGVGSAPFYPNPGDIICFSVTYNYTTNTITAYTVDLTTGRYETLTYNLNSVSYPRPLSRTYIFGVGAATGVAYANWGILYVTQS